MASTIWTWGIDYQGQPLLDAWWTPGWTSQNRDMTSILVPPSAFAPLGFPQNLNYVTVIGNYFDTSANPLSGFLTFWPSTPLTFTVSGITTYMPQRLSGINQTLLGLNQMGDGKIYLWYGQLNVSLMATDNSNMSPASFTYHVKEYYKSGLQYDIVVPGADGTTGTDIHSLIIPGSIRPCSQEDSLYPEEDDIHVRIPVTSSQYIAIDISLLTAGMTENPTLSPVNIAFIAGPTQPQSSNWITAQWAGDTTPYIAQLMIGPNGIALSQGTYQIWAQVILSDGQEPVMPVGFLTIY